MGCDKDSDGTVLTTRSCPREGPRASWAGGAEGLPESVGKEVEKLGKWPSEHSLAPTLRCLGSVCRSAVALLLHQGQRSP